MLEVIIAPLSLRVDVTVVEVDMTASCRIIFRSSQARYLPQIKIEEVLIYQHSDLGREFQQITSHNLDFGHGESLVEALLDPVIVYVENLGQ